MATFKIKDIVRLGADGPHTNTDWIVIRNGDRVNPILTNLNDNVNLLTLRVPLFDSKNVYIDDCTGITCIVRVKINNKWSSEFTLTPIATNVDI